MNKLILPQKKNVFKTNNEDPIFFYYFPIIGWVYKKRLINTLALIDGNYERTLDIGYGSGLLFPSLLIFSKICYGLENHGQEEKVYKMLEKEKIDKGKVILEPGSILEMPFSDNFFDLVVSVSTLEHIKDLDKAMSEIYRVLEKNGKAILSFPVRNTITDCFYKLFGFNPRHIHPSSHNDIIRAAKKYFEVEKILKFPNIKNINHSLYSSIKCVKK